MMKKLKKLGLLGLFLASSAMGAITPTDLATLPILKNYASNGGAENGKSSWTVSGTSSALTDLAVTQAAASVYEGNSAFTWTPANADNFLSNANVTITSNGGLSGQSCAAIVWTKTTDTSHAMEAYDGTNVLGTVTISSSTNFTPQFLNFACPASGTVRLRFNAGATTAITFDNLKWGNARAINLLNVTQVSFVGSAFIAATTNCTGWTRTNTALGSVASDSDCPGPTVEFNNGPGTIQTTDTDLPKFTVNNLPPGQYVVVMQGPQSQNTASVPQFAINDGTTTSGATTSTSTTNNDWFHVTGVFNYTDAGNRTFELYVASVANQVTVSADAANRNLRFYIYRYPSATEQGFKADQMPSFWSGYHDNTCSFARTNTAFGDPTADATCSLVQSLNTNFGTVTTNSSAGNALPGIIFTPKKVGSYYVCANLSVQSATANTATGQRLTDGTTVITDAEYEVTTANRTTQINLCGIYNATTVASTTITVQTKAASGAITLTQTAQRSVVEWTIQAISFNTPAPYLVNSVVSTNNGVTGIESGVLNCDSASAITSQKGSWITSIGNISGGKCIVTLTSGVFIDTPDCLIADTNTSTTPVIVSASATNSTTLNIDCADNAGTACAAFDATVLCKGSR